MSTPLFCLVGFVAWAVSLALALVVWRSLDAARGVRRLDEFPAGVPHGSDVYWRLNRAHLNCLENLPLFGSLVLVAEVAGVPTGPLAPVYLGARLLQSATHLASGAPAAVFVRGTFFTIQLTCLLGMVAKLLRLW